MPGNKRRPGDAGPSRARGSPPPKRLRGKYSVFYNQWGIAKEKSLGHEVKLFASCVRAWCDENPNSHPFTTGHDVGSRNSILLDAYAFREQTQSDFYARLQDTVIRISGGEENQRNVMLCASIANGIRRRVRELAENFESDIEAFQAIPEFEVLKKIHAACFHALIEGTLARKQKGTGPDKGLPNYFSFILPRTDLWITELHQLLRDAGINPPVTKEIKGTYILPGDARRQEGLDKEREFGVEDVEIRGFLLEETELGDFFEIYV